MRSLIWRGRRRGWRALVIAALLATVALTGGCAEDTATKPPARSGEDAVKDAVDDAQSENGTSSGEASGDRRTDRVLRVDTSTPFSYDEYQRTIGATIGLLEQYWRQTLPSAFGVPFTPPRGGYKYYRSDRGGGPKCGNEPAPPRNAFYCPVGDFIAWDESGLMIPYYVGGGDFAAAFVLAHEFGHAMQFRLPRKEPLGVLRELQADCFAGAWARWTADRKLLAGGDLDEATVAVFAARDVPGTPWTDPNAHGTGFERTRAFGDGFEAGPKFCYPARASSWVVAPR